MKLIARALITTVLLVGCSSESNDKSNAAVDAVANDIQISMVKDSACEQWQAGLQIKPKPTAMTDMALRQFDQLPNLDPALESVTLAAYEIRNIVVVMDTNGDTPELLAALAKVWAVVERFCRS
jgi:hypothetical protein